MLRRLLRIAPFALLAHPARAAAPSAPPPAFPEAVGFGSQATGGRAGTVYHVTNLDDAGAGSFRDAVSKPDRIVVFDVGGYITLKSAVSLAGNLTIAGQTAPGGGIGIKSGKISCGAHSNLVIRFLRIRPGSETASEDDVALNLLNAHNVLLDHCSFEFAPWNNIDGVSDDWQKTPVTDITFQYCLNADPIGQQFGAHCESVSSDWAWYRNAFANSHNRNPLAKTNTVYVNNVNYDDQSDYTTHTSTSFKHDIVNNYFILGPASGSANTWFQIDAQQSIYAAGNLRDADLDGNLGGAATAVSWYDGTGTILAQPWSALTKSLPAADPASAFRIVASQAGALPCDAMDSLVWKDVMSLGKSGKLYTSQTATGLPNNGYGTIAGGVRPADGDNDGMPDFWEAAMGSDAAKDDAMAIGSDGYALIEGYLNWLGTLHARVRAGAAADIDLAAMARGFRPVAPTYAVSNPVKGAVVVAGGVARFTAAAVASGIGSFDFTVKGNDGSSWSATVRVLIESGAVGLHRRRAAIGGTVGPGLRRDLRGRFLSRGRRAADGNGARPLPRGT